ncbi:hypothetical protein PTSG_05034 [Salpingoeca rosetta]|uniref:Uncharacterized protein n=1 Tax=Salpingoeca rosetta (strain ATCC 50818 / BSB-021) TaxID=946362 RepID=F2U9B5_SALR5|nr:uncharacterized protein PTSG_05034 [Salpingoeca rosetta]XP_012493086.1 hypothetical protein, variant [Salpingoeca rosetta]EGD73318.1 hypothetical protein, variant [Salpingoeca rosetta]EGD73319.1 hypothetical protein PTSG_05034 [Salpingoeca rosetta]|eukprot:XP_004994349.1 hypothetical protein PTSG_05034 [Salpingoeca rosetta]
MFQNRVVFCPHHRYNLRICDRLYDEIGPNAVGYHEVVRAAQYLTNLRRDLAAEVKRGKKGATERLAIVNMVSFTLARRLEESPEPKPEHLVFAAHAVAMCFNFCVLCLCFNRADFHPKNDSSDDDDDDDDDDNDDDDDDDEE